MYLLTKLFILLFIPILWLDDANAIPASSSRKRAFGCYFELPRYSAKETGNRLPYSKSRASCSNEKTDLYSLAKNKEGELFGAPNELALALSRFEGTFLNDDSDLSDWKGEEICANHRKELLTKFDMYQHKHFKKHPRTGATECGFPEKGHHSKPASRVTYEQSKAFLDENNILLLPGLPICKRHTEQLKEIVENRKAGSSTYVETTDILDIDEGPLDAEESEAQDKFGPEGAEEKDACDLSDDDEEEDDDDIYGPDTAKTYFRKFAKEADIHGVRCWKPYSKITNRAKNYRANAYVQITAFILAYFADTQAGQQDIVARAKAILGDRIPDFEDGPIVQEMLKIGAKFYREASTKHERMWMLAFYSRIFQYRQVVQHIDGLSERTWNEAKKMGIDKESYTESDNTKERYDPIKLEYFISFITSPWVLVGLPFGETRTKDCHGRIVNLLTAIRLHGIEETIRLYEEYMRQMGLESLLLKRSTCRRILSMLPMKQSIAQTCVDLFQVDATNAFIEIGRMIDELVELVFLDSVDGPNLKRPFEEMRMYLKGNCRLHLKTESFFSDHCLFWALSDPNDKHFSMPHTSHEHQQRCVECKMIDETINEMKAMLRKFANKKGLSADVKRKLEIFVNKFDSHAQKIYELKAHYVRAAFASMEKERILDSLQENEAMLTLDYAQRWLPERYRESQSEYFGKSGESWHIIHAQANISGHSVQHSFVHLMKETEQNSTAVAEILVDALSQLHKSSLETPLHSIPLVDPRAFFIVRSADRLSFVFPISSSTLRVESTRSDPRESSFWTRHSEPSSDISKT